MSQNAHYFKIGLFVIGAVSLAVIGIVVLGAGKWFEHKTMVETYFLESVQGLDVGAPVRIRGVSVGRVEAMGLAREEYHLGFNPKAGSHPYRGVVFVRMSVRPTVVVQLKEEDEETVMKMAAAAGFRFRLASQGITGVLYIESEFLQPERYPPMEISWTPKYPYIPSAPSAISELGSDLRAVVRKLDQVEFDRIAQDLMATLAAITQVVKDVQAEQLGKEAKQVLADLRGTIGDAQRVLDDPTVGKVLKNSGAALEDFRRTAAELSQTAKEVRGAVLTLPDTMTRLNRSMRRIDVLLAEKGETVDDLLENLRLVSEDLHHLTNAVEQYPSQVLFGDPPSRAQGMQR